MEQAFGLKMLKKKKHLLAYTRLDKNALRWYCSSILKIIYCFLFSTLSSLSLSTLTLALSLSLSLSLCDFVLTPSLVQDLPLELLGQFCMEFIVGHVGCGESCMEIGVARWVFILGGFKWGFDRWKEIGSTDRVGFNGVLIGVGSVEIGVLSDVYGDRVLIASITFWWGFDQVGSNVLSRLDFDCVGAEIMGLLVF